MNTQLRQQIEQFFDVVGVNTSTGELTFICPECGDKKGHRSVNLKTGMTFCFRCGKGDAGRGHVIAWAKSLGFNLDGGTFSVPMEDLFKEDASTDVYIPLAAKVNLPKGFTSLEEAPNTVRSRLIGEMAERKNLSFETLRDAGVGFTRIDPLWEPFAIFPVVEWGVTVYYQGRTYVDVPGEPTKKFPSRNEVPYGAANWLYNFDELRRKKAPTVMVVESILNVLSLREELAYRRIENVVPVCVFKHHISKVQLLKLVRMNYVKELCFLFDHDAIDKVWSSVGNLGNRVRMTVAEMPAVDGNKKLDPNDDVLAAMQAFDARTEVSKSTVVGRLLDRKWSSVYGKEVDLRSMRFG